MQKGWQNIMKKIIICSLLAMLLSKTALAAEVETYVNFDTREVSVTGQIEEAAFNRMLSVEVKDDTMQYYVNTIGTEADGSYNLTFRMPESAQTGNYQVSVEALGMSEPVQKDFYFAQKQDIDNILNLINSSTGASGLLTAIEANIDVLNIPIDWYNTLDQNGKMSVAQALYDSKPYSAIGDATNVAYKELAVQAFRCADSADKIESALNEFASVFNINKDTAVCYDLYNSFGYKKEACDIMSGYDCTDVAGVIKAYNESTLLAAINKAGDPLKIKTLINDYRNVIPFSMATYDKSDIDKTVTYLYKYSDIKTMSALEAAIEAAYKQQTTPSQSTGNGGGGGGSSSGSSGGSSIGSINRPPVSTIPNSNSQTTDSQDSTFTDLDSVEWAQEAIEYLADKNIVNGTGDNKFEPNNFVTREQFVLMIANAFNIKDSAAVCDFSDMPKSHWAYEAVASAYQSGIVLGESDQLFGTGQPITRQDMAIIAYRAATKAGYEFENTGELTFSDSADIADYAKESVAAMSAKGIINGYPDSRFAPLDTATRAQAAKIIYAIIK